MKSCNSSSGVSLSAKLTSSLPSPPPTLHLHPTPRWGAGAFLTLTFKKPFTGSTVARGLRALKGNNSARAVADVVTSVIAPFHRTLKKISAAHNSAPLHAIFQLCSALPG